MNIDNVVSACEKIDPNKIKRFCDLVNAKSSIIILGNGGSNAIASHISQDYTKKLKKRSFTFSDPSRLTCYINDYGMEQANLQFLKEFSDPDTLVVLISSSGNSVNILNCAEYCVDKKLDFVILTGFDQSNKLRSYSPFTKEEFWIDSKDYGVVECVHQIILHTPV